MKVIWFSPAVAAVLALASCREKPAEVEVSETRPLTLLDKEPAVNASSAEQFLPPKALAQIRESGQTMKGVDGGAPAEKPSWSYQLPAADWGLGPEKAMREVNLVFGEGEKGGEIYLSVSGGGIQPNVDRWFRQFGNDPQPISDLGRLQLLGKQGYLVETSGRYEPGMGRPGKDGQALLGALVENEGRLITVKMIGPQEEISSRREQFLKFVASLQKN